VTENTIANGPSEKKKQGKKKKKNAEDVSWTRVFAAPLETPRGGGKGGIHEGGVVLTKEGKNKGVEGFGSKVPTREGQ